jgi:hypothetical protein
VSIFFTSLETSVDSMIRFNESFIFDSPRITAASGLVHKENKLYVVSDDELGLICLKVDLSEKAMFHKILDGELPQNEEERKKKKPDFECLTLFEDSLLLISSGSKPNRHLGALVRLEDFQITHLSFKNVFKELTGLIPELNIEGAVTYGDKILLLQRGNGKMHLNALIELNLQSFLKDELLEVKITPIDLGKINHTPLGFTDATLHENHVYFLSVAESSESTYLDGAFLGACLGVMTIQGEIIKTTPLDISAKPEGLSIIDQYLYVVTDSDSRKVSSKLFKSQYRI